MLQDSIVSNEGDMGASLELDSPKGDGSKDGDASLDLKKIQTDVFSGVTTHPREQQIDPRLKSKWLIPAEDEIWSKINDRLQMYVKDANYDFVESMPYFNQCTRFHENFYKEIVPELKGFEVRCNLLQYLIVMNLRVM